MIRRVRAARSAPLFAAAVLAASAPALAARQRPAPPRDTLPAELPAEPPYGLPERIPDPADNPFSRERAELGRKLFFDPILSLDRSVACASCHVPATGFADREPTSLGVLGRRTERNAPSLFNRGFGSRHMWDGRAGSLEEQVLLPIANEREMALPLAEALERLRGDEALSASFGAAFEDGVSEPNLARALASFVRRLWLADSPVDRFRAGEFGALDAEERVGLWTFEGRGRCWRCHAGANFTDESFHDTGVGARDGAPEEGRFAVTGREEDRGRFKTPTLRGVALTAPYMHDGSFASLEEVVAFYRLGGNPNRNLDPLLEPIEMTDREAAALVAFLGALSRTAPPR